MNTIVLIVILLTQNGQAGIMGNVEFHTMKACLKAATEVARDARENFPAGTRLIASCHSK